MSVAEYEQRLLASARRAIICHQCPHKGKPLDGAMACMADPQNRDVVWHAENDDCPIDAFDAGAPLNSAATVEAVIARIRMGAVLAPDWHLWPNVQKAHRRLMVDAAAAAGRLPPPAGSGGRGIVMVGGGKYLASLYVTIRILRHVVCGLPIEVFHLGEAEIPPWARTALSAYDVSFVDAHVLREKFPARILGGWELKTYAPLHTRFAEFIMLDCDSYPVRDPTFLFDDPGYQKHGALFWYDPARFAIAHTVWEILGMGHHYDPVLSYRLETGQMVIDRAKVWRELNLAWWLSDHSDYYYRLWHGDVGCFAFGWTYLGRAFARAPGPWKWEHPAMLQPDPQGQTLFVHRANGKFTLADPQKDFARQTFQYQNVRNDRLPMEAEAWGFLEEFRQLAEANPSPASGCSGCGDRKQSMVERLVHGAAGLGAAAVARVTGIGGVPDEVAEERLKICRVCPHIEQIVGGIERCRMCACLLMAKTRVAHELCPLPVPKWNNWKPA